MRTYLTSLLATLTLVLLAAGASRADGPVIAWGLDDYGQASPPDEECMVEAPMGKVLVCHKGRKTLSIAPAAVPAHLAHGDTLGECRTAPLMCGEIGGFQCQSPNEFCLFPPGTCDWPDAPGECILRPEICTDEHAPVCGCDGSTYGNECNAWGAGVSVLYPGECRDIRVTVTDINGEAIDGFLAEFHERGERTSSQVQHVAFGPTTIYIARDRAATILVVVDKVGYHPGMELLESSQESESNSVRNAEIRLIPVDQCLIVSEDCLGATIPGAPGVDYAPGDVLVGVPKWLWSSEIVTFFEPYCMATEVGRSLDLFSMWIVVLEGDVGQVINELESSDIVMWADQRGWSGGPVSGATVLVQFNLSATINAARDLVDSIEGVEWLKTGLKPKWARVNVPVGSEGEWICEFEKDPMVRYAQPNYIYSIDDSQ